MPSADFDSAFSKLENRCAQRKPVFIQTLYSKIQPTMLSQNKAYFTAILRMFKSPAILRMFKSTAILRLFDSTAILRLFKSTASETLMPSTVAPDSTRLDPCKPIKESLHE